MKDMMTMKMSDLEMVTGGIYTETSGDTGFLKDIGLLNIFYSKEYTRTHWDEVSKIVEDAWAKVGVDSHTDLTEINTYTINGQRAARVEAMLYAARVIARNKNE